MIQYQGINSLSNLKMNFFKIMFRIPYPVQIKILIFNQLRIFNSLLSFLLVQFLGNPLLSSVYPIYKLLILDGFLKFQCFSLDFPRMGIKLLIFSPYGSYRIFFGEKRIFILYIFPYLHLGSPFPLSVLFSFIKSNPQQYRFIIMSRIISPGNLYSKIYEFLFLFNHMHDFLPFYLFIYLFFPGFTPVLPLRQSKLHINKHLDCYCLVFELLLSDLSSDF